jgi:hypothetical protein
MTLRFVALLWVFGFDRFVPDLFGGFGLRCDRGSEKHAWRR